MRNTQLPRRTRFGNGLTTNGRDLPAADLEPLWPRVQLFGAEGLEDPLECDRRFDRGRRPAGCVSLDARHDHALQLAREVHDLPQRLRVLHKLRVARDWIRRVRVAL